MSESRGHDFADLLAFIEAELDFESGFYNDAYLERRITARMRRRNVESFAAYERLLEDDGDERADLLDSLSINVTGFFRNPDAWEALRPILQTLTEEHLRVRVWSAPCADGREPYSLAMLAMDDPAIDERRISILATDINEDVLKQARAGVYQTSTTTDIEAELDPLSGYDPYVDREGEEFRVTDAVKRHVTFERHDLIRGDPKRDFDLILCRNLLIYIDSAYKVPVFETVRGSLRTGGYLVIGMTETLPPECREDFEAVDKRHRIYRTLP